LPHLQLHFLLLKTLLLLLLLLLLLRRFRIACAALLPRWPLRLDRPCHRLTHHQLQGRDRLLLLLAAACRKSSTRQRTQAATRIWRCQ
jgi:hypothetical protein